MISIQLEKDARELSEPRGGGSVFDEKGLRPAPPAAGPEDLTAETVRVLEDELLAAAKRESQLLDEIGTCERMLRAFMRSHEKVAAMVGSAMCQCVECARARAWLRQWEFARLNRKCEERP